MTKNLNNLLFFIIAPAIFIYALCRAYYVPFTVDESTSYLAMQEFPQTLSHLRSANTHPVNTLLMKVCSLLFGDSELSLRLPNLVALLFYMIYTYKILCFVSDRQVRFFGFLVLNINPFLLDFFSLARGYGLATTLSIISLYYLLSFFSKRAICFLWPI